MIIIDTFLINMAVTIWQVDQEIARLICCNLVLNVSQVLFLWWKSFPICFGIIHLLPIFRVYGYWTFPHLLPFPTLMRARSPWVSMVCVRVYISAREIPTWFMGFNNFYNHKIVNIFEMVTYSIKSLIA